MKPDGVPKIVMRGADKERSWSGMKLVLDGRDLCKNAAYVRLFNQGIPAPH